MTAGRYPLSLTGRFLNLPVMVWVGTLSYSLYLWQQLWAFGDFRLGAAARLGGMLACACSSYYLIERPLLGLRARLRWVPIADVAVGTGASPEAPVA